MAIEGAAPRLLRARTDGVSQLAVVIYASAVLIAALYFDVTHLVVAAAAIRLISYVVCSAGLVKMSLIERKYLTCGLAALASSEAIALLTISAL